MDGMRPLARPSGRLVRQVGVLVSLLALVVLTATGALASAGSTRSSPRPASEGLAADRSAHHAVAHPMTQSTPTALSATSFNRMAVDDVNQHVFLSNPSDGTVTVMNFDGTVDLTITGLTEPYGMAVSTATHKLYVAENSLQTVQVVDTISLLEGTTYTLGVCPYDLALAGGFLWYSYYCRDAPGAEGLGSVNLGTKSVQTVDGALGGCCLGMLSVDPTTPTVLYSAIQACPVMVTKFDVTTATPVQLAQYNSEDGCSPYGPMSDMTAVPGQGQLVSTSDQPWYGLTWNTSDMSPGSVQYASEGDPVAVAATGDGAYVAVGSGVDSTQSIDVLVSAAGSATAWSGFASGDGDEVTLQNQGLAFSGDSSKLFAVAYDSTVGHLVFSVLDDPTEAGSFFSSLSLGPGGVVTGQPLTFSGTLTLSDGAGAAGQTIHLSRMNPDLTVTPLPDVVTDGSGNFTFTETPTVAGWYNYYAVWDGDGGHSGTRGEQSIQVGQSVLPKGLLTISVAHTAVPYQGAVTVTAYLQKPTSPGAKSVTIYAVATTGITTSVTGTLNGSRKFAHVFHPGRTTNYHAVWAGDSGHSQTSSGVKKVTVGSLTHQQLLGFYKMSGSYHLYHYKQTCVNDHHTGCPQDVATVVPNNSGGQVCLTSQIFYSGAWRNPVTICLTLDVNSQNGAFLYYSGRNFIGIPVRVHSVFKGTGWNRGSTSPWIYLKITS